MEGTNRPFYRLLFLYSSATSAGNHKEKTWTVTYPTISSAIRPVPHTEDLQQQYILDSDNEPTGNRENTPQPSTSTNADFTAELQFDKFH
jgi:hypothetical protein